jgi:hypothetical protein
MKQDEMVLDEMSLVATGQISLPKKSFRARRFWSIGANAGANQKLKRAMNQAIAAERDENNPRYLRAESA